MFSWQFKTTTDLWWKSAILESWVVNRCLDKKPYYWPSKALNRGGRCTKCAGSPDHQRSPHQCIKCTTPRSPHRPPVDLNMKLPILRMSLEVIFAKKFNEKLDVWAFATILFELATSWMLSADDFYGKPATESDFSCQQPVCITCFDYYDFGYDNFRIPLDIIEALGTWMRMHVLIFSEWTQKWFYWKCWTRNADDWLTFNTLADALVECENGKHNKCIWLWVNKLSYEKNSFYFKHVRVFYEGF